MQGNLDMNNNRLYNLAQPNGNNQPATKIYTDTNFLPLNGNSAMAGPLNMFNNKINHLANPIASGDAINKSWTESNFLKLSGGTMSGALAMGNNNWPCTSNSKWKCSGL